MHYATLETTDKGFSVRKIRFRYSSIQRNMTVLVIGLVVLLACMETATSPNLQTSSTNLEETTSEKVPGREVEEAPDTEETVEEVYVDEEINETVEETEEIEELSEEPETQTVNVTVGEGETLQYQVPENSGEGRRIVYAKEQQRVWVIDENEAVLNTHLVSGHRTGVYPPVGTHAVASKSRHTTSLDGNVRMEYMVRFWFANRAWVGFHSIPVRPNGTLIQSLDDLGTVQSIGCIRAEINDAKFIYEFSEEGTKVVVVE